MLLRFVQNLTGTSMLDAYLVQLQCRALLYNCNHIENGLHVHIHTHKYIHVRPNWNAEEDNSGSLIELAVFPGLQVKPIPSMVCIDTITDGIEELIALCKKNRRKGIASIADGSDLSAASAISYEFAKEARRACLLRQFAVENISLSKVE